jgi:HAD superfamily hydrolase (TIGR01509 family)
MTNIITDLSIHTVSASIEAVLFDFSGTLLADSYVHHGLANLADLLDERWDIDRQTASSGFVANFGAVSAEYLGWAFYMMRDAICAALDRLIADCGHSATRGELVYLEHQFWAAAIPAAVAAEGAIETLTLLREAGIKTGIVSYADIAVFEGLLEQSGLASLTDVEVCSEAARSCKPHPAIFEQALTTIAAKPSRTMFVGDSVDTDIVGGNRMGMHTALLAAQPFTLGGSSTEDRLTHPDHHVSDLLDVANIVIRRAPSSLCA